MQINSAKDLKVYQKAKRRYEAHFISKLTDAMPEQHQELTALRAEVGRMLGSLISNPGPFLISDR